MKKAILALTLFVGLIFVTCNSSNEYIAIESKDIPNFSVLSDSASKEFSYFSDMNRLPIGFTLGDHQDYNSIVYLTGSANITPIDDKILQLFLTTQELETAFDMFIDSSVTEPNTRKVQYYPFERLVTDNYVLLLLNKRNNFSKGRDYTFTIRMYDFEGNIISSLDFARWDDIKQIFLGGMILSDMQIEIRSRDRLEEKHQILGNGVIELIENFR